MVFSTDTFLKKALKFNIFIIVRIRRILPYSTLKHLKSLKTLDATQQVLYIYNVDKMKALSGNILNITSMDGIFGFGILYSEWRLLINRILFVVCLKLVFDKWFLLGVMIETQQNLNSFDFLKFLVVCSKKNFWKTSIQLVWMGIFLGNFHSDLVLTVFISESSSDWEICNYNPISMGLQRLISFDTTVLEPKDQTVSGHLGRSSSVPPSIYLSVHLAGWYAQ